MGLNCSVCGLPGKALNAVRAEFRNDERTRETHVAWVAASSPGAACSPECATFVFVRPRHETADERVLTDWRWRQRRAEVRGEAFDEPAPMDEGERALVLWESRRRHSPMRQPGEDA